MQACLEEDINVWGSKCVGQVRGNVNAKENALKGPNHWVDAKALAYL